MIVFNPERADQAGRRWRVNVLQHTPDGSTLLSRTLGQRTYPGRRMAETVASLIRVGLARSTEHGGSR